MNKVCEIRSIAAVALFWMGGCDRGPETGTVVGTLNLAGRSHGDVAIVLMSLKTGCGGTCDVASDGNFRLPKPLVVGEYAVYVAPKVVPDGGDAPPAPVKADTRIPAKYWSESSTDVKVVVKPGANEFRIDLRP